MSGWNIPTGFPVASRTSAIAQGGGAIASFRVQLDTALDATATDADLVSVFSAISAAGGTDISVLRDGGPPERPHAAFLLEAEAHEQARAAVAELLSALGKAAPSIDGGWALVSIRELSSEDL